MSDEPVVVDLATARQRSNRVLDEEILDRERAGALEQMADAAIAILDIDRQVADEAERDWINGVIDENA